MVPTCGSSPLITGQDGEDRAWIGLRWQGGGGRGEGWPDAKGGGLSLHPSPWNAISIEGLEVPGHHPIRTSPRALDLRSFSHQWVTEVSDPGLSLPSTN